MICTRIARIRMLCGVAKFAVGVIIENLSKNLVMHVLLVSPDVLTALLEVGWKFPVDC